MKTFVVLIAIFVVTIAADAQPGPAASELQIYADAMAVGKKWIAENNQYKAEPAFSRAVDLAKTDTEKIEAMLARAAALRWMMNDTATYTSKSPYYKTRTMRIDESHALYQEVLKIASLTPARADEVRLMDADVLRACSSDTMCPPALEQKIKTEAKLDLSGYARREYTKLIDNAATSADTRILAYIGRSKTLDTSVVFGSIKKENVIAAFNDLKAATEVAQGKDENKAKAYFDIVELATTINDANSVAAAYEAVTKLPAATNEQKINAYKGLVLLMLGNNMIKGSREKLAEAGKLAGLNNDQKATVSRLTALTMMIDADPSDAAAVAKQKKNAIAELDKTTSIVGMADEEKFKTSMATAEFLQNITAAYPLALDQLDKAIKLKKIDDKLRAEAQYQIGEVYRVQKRIAEAKEAYAKVSNVNPRYYNYAQQRLKELGSPTAAATPNED